MDEEQNNSKVVKETLKKSGKQIAKVALIVVAILFLVALIYIILKEDIDKLSKTQANYSTKINSEGKLVYVKKDPETGEETEITTEEMAEELAEVLRYYVDGDEEEYQKTIDYLLGAEATVKLPYIDGSTSEIEGRVKFYRYTGEEQVNDAYTDPWIGEEKLKEQYRLTYVKPETFDEQLENYKSSGNQEVFKHFTMDDDANVVVAYGSVETRNITTQDPDLTLELVHENSGESSYTGNYKDGFSMVRYTASTRKIKYLSLVQQYVMPMNLFYSFLIQTGDIDFVMDLAKLAYESEIAIGIYDNETVSTTSETYTYKKMMETNVKTSLNFEGIHTTNPIITNDDLYDSPYSHVPYMCVANTVEGRISHKLHYYNPSEAFQSPQNADYMFITGQTDDGAITGLGSSGNDYTVTYNKKINTTSAPTVGLMLADTWIAKFKASYEKEEETEEQTDSGPLEDNRLIEYNTNDEVLNAFDNNMRNNITTKLNTHASKLKSDAITAIKGKIDFTVLPVDNSITVNDLTEAKKKDILKSHKNECTICSALINEWWDINGSGIFKIDALYDELIKSNGDFKGTKVLTHYNDELEEFVNERNQVLEILAKQDAERKTEEKEATFTSELNSQITTSQILSAGKKYVDINFQSLSTTVTSKYKKSETTERTNDGDKFREIFNKLKYYDAKQAILKREAWFWEYIRQNEDTSKLEDILRYLLNIATDSNKFGDFEPEDIEKLFEAFEPEEQLSISTLSGNNVEVKVWFALINLGYSKAAAAGVLANLWAESDFKTNNLEDSFESLLGFDDETYTQAINDGTYSREEFISDHTSDDAGAGYGLAQWTWFTRKAGLYDFAKHKGVSIDDEDMQVEYLLGELGHSEFADGFARDNVASERKGYTIDDWKNAESPEQAAAAFCFLFENPDLTDTSERERKGRELYEKYKDFDQGGIFTRDTSGNGWCIGTFTSSITGRTFTIFNQMNDTLWYDRCNRAAQISVCSGYKNQSVDEWIATGNAMPDYTAPVYGILYSECGLTLSTQASNLGSPYTFDSNKIKEQIQNGGYVILYVRGNDQGATGVSNYGRDWASAAHWVAILGYRETTGAGEIFVSDSGHGLTGWVPLDEFDDITHTVHFVNEQ